MELIKALWKLFTTVMTNKYLVIMIILVILLKALYPKLRGFMGEFWVKQELKKLPKDKYMILNDVMLSKDGSTHQIDHLVISSFGIFVIEMKNYYGLILGDTYKDKWIQYLGRSKNYFLNPIHQNYGHVKVLEELLNLDNNIFISVICFSNQVKLKVKTKNIVVSLDDLVSTIQSYQNIILECDLDTIYNRIKELNIIDKAERKNHVYLLCDSQASKRSEFVSEINNIIRI